MLDFFKDKTKRKAFKRAILEVEQEEALNRSRSSSDNKHTKDNTISRVYKSVAEEENTQGVYKIKNPLKRPETTAIDLKHFKDWRKVDKVESKQPKYVDKKPAFVFSDDEEEILEPKKIFSGGEFVKPSPETEPTMDGNSSLDLAEKIYAIPREEKQKDLSASSYVKQKSKEDFGKKSLKEMLEAVAPNSAKRYEQEKAQKAEEEKHLAEEKRKADELKRQERIKRREESQEAKIKVEVIDFTPKQEPKPEPKPEPKVVKKKEPTNRKPRGKAKKRYDADVISAINWKKPNKK